MRVLNFVTPVPYEPPASRDQTKAMAPTSTDSQWLQRLPRRAYMYPRTVLPTRKTARKLMTSEVDIPEVDNFVSCLAPSSHLVYIAQKKPPAPRTLQ